MNWMILLKQQRLTLLLILLGQGALVPTTQVSDCKKDICSNNYS